MKKFYVLILFAFFGAVANAQSFVWAKQSGGNTTICESKAITVDDSGNVYTTGLFKGTVDFDPGAGIYNLTSVGSTDIFVTKISPSGNLIWARQMGGNAADAGYSIAVDDSGNVITTGYYQGSADFDPDTSYYYMSGMGMYNIFISKLNSHGKFVWAKSYDGYGRDIGYSVAVNDSGYIYLTGCFSAMLNFPMDTLSYSLTTAGGTDILVMKLNASGKAIWARRFGADSDDAGSSIKVDADNNVYITGSFQGTVNFNYYSYHPSLYLGPDQKLKLISNPPLNLTSAGATDIFVLKLDSASNTVWAKRAGGISSDAGCSIAFDASGNVITGGYFNEIANFDPGTGTYNLTATGDTTAFVSKYDASGNFLWAKQIGGNLSDATLSLTTDASGSIYTTGYFQGTVDFDPNAGTFNMTAVDSSDIFISKLDAGGNYVWAKQMGGTRNETGNAIAIDTSGNVYTTGCFSGTADFNPNPGVYNLTSIGDTDMFICKYHHPDILQVSVTTYSANCNQSNGWAEVTITGGILPYQILWSNGDTTNIADTLAAGTYSVYVTGAGGVSKSVYFVINNTGITLSPSMIQNVHCRGGDDGAVNLTITGGTAPYIIHWSNGANTQNITGLLAGAYDVNVTDANGCMGFTSVTIMEPTEITYTYNNLLPDCGFNDGKITITPSGGTPPYTYLWGTGETTDTITGVGAGNYIVFITDANSCNIMAQVSLSNFMMPEPVITVDSLQAATCGGNGAAYITVSNLTPPLTYHWSNGFNGEDLVGFNPGNYSLKVTDSLGCIAATHVEIPPVLLPVQPICMVTVDSLNNGNKIIWQKVLTTGVDYYKIYRETSVPDQFLFIDTVRFTSMSKYTDLIANPMTRSWSYKISQVDLCGYESPLSDLALHKTIHLTMNNEPGNSFKLVWDDYEGYSYSYFYINRHTNSSGWTVIDSVPKTMHTYTDVPPSLNGLKYMISVKKPDSCVISVNKDQTETYNTSVSNMEEYQIYTNVEENLYLSDLNIYPNPATDKIEISSEKSEIKSVEIYNLQGQQLMSAKFSNPKNIVINVGALAKGIYLIKIQTNNNTVNRKLVLQ